MTHVVIVDAEDREIEPMEKMKAHREGHLHRAFSVFLFTSSGDMILQRRADEKYHSGGLWSNTCCGHPRMGEDVRLAARERLRYEMGIECEIEHRFSFQYRAVFDNGLVEHELDHVFTGVFDGVPRLNAEEASAWKRLTAESISADLPRNPERYTTWFRIAFPKVAARSSAHHNSASHG